MDRKPNPYKKGKPACEVDADAVRAALAVKKFLDEEAKLGGMDHEELRAIQVGSDKEAKLLRSDLQLLVDHAMGWDLLGSEPEKGGAT